MGNNLVKSHKNVERDLLGRNLFETPKNTKATRYVIILNTNIMMGFIKLHKICNEALQHFGLGMMFCYLNMLIFGLKYTNTIKNDVYNLPLCFQKKSIVFC
jgi:hypothetical protein